MCSVLISEQNTSRIDTTSVENVSITVVGTVRASRILMNNRADDYDYTRSIKT